VEHGDDVRDYDVRVALATEDIPIAVTVEHPRPGTVIVCVAGEVDILTGRDLETALYHQLTPDLRTLVVDLSEVTYLGSTGLSILCRAKEVCQQLGISLSMAGIGRECVIRPLQIVGLGEPSTSAQA
jgi:anti-sigma B factor antagonist